MLTSPVHLSSFTTKTKSCTYICHQTYPFQCSSFEGPTLTFRLFRLHYRDLGHMLIWIFTCWPHPLSTQQCDPGFFLSTWPPALHLTCIYILTSLISTMQDSTSDLPAGLLSLLLNSMSSRTTFRIAALLALPLPGLLLPQKSHWFIFPSVLLLRRGSGEHLAQSLKSDSTFTFILSDSTLIF